MSMDSEAEMVEEMATRKEKLEHLYPNRTNDFIFPNFGLVMGTKSNLLKFFVELLKQMNDFSDGNSYTFSSIELIHKIKVRAPKLAY